MCLLYHLSKPLSTPYKVYSNSPKISLELLSSHMNEFHFSNSYRYGHQIFSNISVKTQIIEAQTDIPKGRIKIITIQLMMLLLTLLKIAVKIASINIQIKPVLNKGSIHHHIFSPFYYSETSVFRP